MSGLIYQLLPCRVAVVIINHSRANQDSFRQVAFLAFSQISGQSKATIVGDREIDQVKPKYLVFLQL